MFIQQPVHARRFLRVVPDEYFKFGILHVPAHFGGDAVIYAFINFGWVGTYSADDVFPQKLRRAGFISFNIQAQEFGGFWKKTKPCGQCEAVFVLVPIFSAMPLAHMRQELLLEISYRKLNLQMKNSVVCACELAGVGVKSFFPEFFMEIIIAFQLCKIIFINPVF